MNLEDTLLQGTRASQPAASLVAEGSLYFVTDEDITEQSLASAWTPYSGPAASGSAITALTGDVTATGPGSVAATIANDAVTYAKMQNVSAASKLLGRGSAGGAGNPEEITISTGLTLTGTTLTASGAAAIDQLTGDVTAGPGSGSQAATIANDAVTTVKILDANVTYAKIQDVTAASRLLGRGSAGGSGDVQELTVGSGLSITGTVLDTAGSSGITQLTGDVTAGPGSGSQAATIPNDTVTYAKMQNVSAADRLLGRGNGGGSGDVQEISLGSGLSLSGTTLSATGGATAGSILLATRTASNSSSLDFTSVLSSTYDEYEFVYTAITPQNSNVDIDFLVSTNNGSSYAGGTDYTWAGIHYRAGTASGQSNSGGAQIKLLNNATIQNTTAKGGFSGRCTLMHVNNTSQHKFLIAQSYLAGNDGLIYGANVTGVYLQTTAVNAVRFIFTSGNIVSGTIKCYGISK